MNKVKILYISYKTFKILKYQHQLYNITFPLKPIFPVILQPIIKLKKKPYRDTSKKNEKERSRTVIR